MVQFPTVISNGTTAGGKPFVIMQDRDRDICRQIFSALSSISNGGFNDTGLMVQPPTSGDNVIERDPKRRSWRARKHLVLYAQPGIVGRRQTKGTVSGLFIVV